MSAAFDEEIRALLAAGARNDAIARIFSQHGRRIGVFLYQRVRDLSLTEDLLQAVFEQVIQAIERWRGQGLIAWLYRIALSVVSRHFRDPAHRARQRASLAEVPALALVAAQARTDTMRHLRTSVQAQVHDLWGEFSPDEQTLLHLRLREQLGWNEIARLLGGEALPEEQVTRRAQALRQQFQRLKTRLARRVAEAGIGEPPDGAA
ncbi:MAG: sigma-70 family RNA polymerase sigma factor [bacterium]